MKRYTSRAPELSMTVMVGGKLQRIQFKQGFFETDVEEIQACIESNNHFGSEIQLLNFDPVKAEAEVKKVMKKFNKKVKKNTIDFDARAKKMGIEESFVEEFINNKVEL